MIALCRQSDRALDVLKGMIIFLFKFRFVCYRNALSIQVVKNLAIATYRPSSLNVSKTHNVHMDIKLGVEKNGKQRYIVCRCNKYKTGLRKLKSEILSVGWLGCKYVYMRK